MPLTKDQAQQIAKDLLRQQEAARDEKFERRTRRLPWYYQVAGLRERSRKEQGDALDAARRHLRGSLSYWLATLVYLAVWVVAAWLRPEGSAWAPWGPLLGMGGMVLLRVVWMRRILRAHRPL